MAPPMSVHWATPTKSNNSGCNSSSSSPSSSSCGSAGVGVVMRRSPQKTLEHPIMADPPILIYNNKKRRVRKRSPDASNISGTSVSIRRSRYQVIWTLLWALLIAACGLARWNKDNQGVWRGVRQRIPDTTNQTVAATATAGVAETEPEVVHVIQTRFMQHQPDLVELGLARLDIFLTFCLPTMMQQTSKNFLWIIRTDPMLNETVKDPLLEVLKTHDNFVLLASNENPEGFRSADMKDVTPESVWTDNYDLLMDRHAAAQSRVVLETRLDADDGLHRAFVAYIQSQTLPIIQSPTDWMVWCAYSHLEWHYSSPFSSSSSSKQVRPEGHMVGLKTDGCVTPGLTMVYGVDTRRSNLPEGHHERLHTLLPPCSDSVRVHCLDRFRELNPGAIRARTPTSAGMKNVVVGELGTRSMYKKADAQRKVQDAIWEGVFKMFDIDRYDVIETRKYLGEHMKEIAADNLRGQCTRGHSCKGRTKDFLKKLMNPIWVERLIQKEATSS